MSQLNVSGVLVHAKLDELAQVCARLEAIDGVDIQATTDDGRIVMLVETEDPANTVDCFTQVQNLEGVLSASLVYHYNEQQDPAKEEISS